MQQLYSDFMEEYEKLDHMERVIEDALPCNNYYLPHHGVYKAEKATTPLRVVFNASSPSSNGISLNDILLKGDVVENIFDLILRFRTHKYAFTADIKKMFRQILVSPSQRDFLRILWIDENTKNPITFRLKTVTYGTTSAPYLAIRTLKQLALDEASSFPLASEITLRDFYMDDVLSGAKDIESARILQHQLIKMLKRGGMDLHKWASNLPELLDTSPNLNHKVSINEEKNSNAKTLGMNWLSNEDNFAFYINHTSDTSFTKGSVLSFIARLYDPLGLLGPIICKAKIFMQKLWLHQLRWEDKLPIALANEWNTLVKSFRNIEQIKIPRWILVDDCQKFILHCFADASKYAFGAVIYLQCIRTNDCASSMMLTSKSRVAPLKIISIPRLELCACLLASKLRIKVEQALHLQIDRVIMYTDSTIALSWIHSKPHQLKTFVANRVSKIQQMGCGSSWQHVSSNLNPADVISRGMFPEELADNKLWWNGPPFLQEPTSMDLATEQFVDFSTDK